MAGDADTAFFLSAFWELCNDRPRGFGPAPIPFSAIARYAEWTGITPGDDFEFFADMIRACDRAWMEAAESGGGPSQATGRPMSPGLYDALFS